MLGGVGGFGGSMWILDSDPVSYHSLVTHIPQPATTEQPSTIKYKAAIDVLPLLVGIPPPPPPHAL